MFINPTYAIEQGWVKGIKNADKQVQPNAIDFTLDKLFVLSTDPASLSETMKTMRNPTLVEPTPSGWAIEYQRVYDGMSDMYVELPDGIAAILYTRSTLTRNGVFLASGLYDSGFKGHVGFTIYPIGGRILIEPGTRVGQIAFVAAASAKMYAGGWNHEEGSHFSGLK